MIIGLILIYKKFFFKIIMKIYHQIIKLIIKCKFNYHVLYKVIWPKITMLEKVIIKDLLIICANGNMQQ